MNSKAIPVGTKVKVLTTRFAWSGVVKEITDVYIMLDNARLMTDTGSAYVVPEQKPVNGVTINSCCIVAVVPQV